MYQAGLYHIVQEIKKGGKKPHTNPTKPSLFFFFPLLDFKRLHYTQCAVPCESSEPLPQPITSRKRAPVLVGAHLLYSYDSAVSPGGDAWRWLLWWLPGLLTQAVIDSQHPQVQHHPPVATGVKETWSKKLEKLVGDSTEIAEEDAEVAQDADSRVWGG